MGVSENNVFAERLREVRTAKGVSQQKAAKGVGIAESNYQNYEYGQQRPGFETLCRLADYFDVSIDYLVGRTDVPRVIYSARQQEKFPFAFTRLPANVQKTLLKLAKQIGELNQRSEETEG